MRGKGCIACGLRLPEKPLLVLDGMPASAQDIPDAKELKVDTGISLKLYRCKSCGLVQFDCQPVSYYKDVIRSGGFTSTMVNLRRRQFSGLIDTYGLKGKKFIEAGCGQGEFLSVLQEFPVKVYGIEHKADLAEVALNRGLTVWRQFAGSETTRLSQGSPGVTGPFDVFLSFNFLEHQPDPVGMLRCLYYNLAPDGMGLITVPSLEYILEHDGYYELIRDHLAYYTFDTLRFVLEQAGFWVLEEEMVNGDTLSVVVRKKALAPESGRAVPHGGSGSDALAVSHGPSGSESLSGRSIESGISGLVKSRGDLNREIDRLLLELKNEGRSLAIWGASHQGFTLAATTALRTGAKYIIDSAPFKQGRFAPASHIPIVAPEHFMEDPVAVILIVAPGYTEEIRGIIKKGFGRGVEILTLRSKHIERLTDI